MSRRLLAPITVVVAIAVVTPAATADTTRTSTPPAVLTAYYDSGQWSKAMATVVKKAKSNLKKDLSSSTAPRHPAIVLDIDETAVFNAPCLEPVRPTGPPARERHAQLGRAVQVRSARRGRAARVHHPRERRRPAVGPRRRAPSAATTCPTRPT